jgi:acyl-ACP thioesterase
MGVKMVVSQNFYIGYRDVDCNLNMKNNAILDLFQEMAGIHASMCGQGTGCIETAWVLTGYKVNILKRPVYGETVEAITWARDIKGITSCREFELKNKEGELLVCAVSNWAHVNIADKKLVKIDEQVANAYGLEPDKTNFEELRLKKLVEPDNYEYTKEYIVDWDWIDCNHHMNNTYYVVAAEMMLPDEVKFKNEYSGFEIMYKKEIKYKEKIKCLYTELEDSHLITIKNEDLSQVHAIVKLKK